MGPYRGVRGSFALDRPATLTITARRTAKTTSRLEAGREVEHARDTIGFRWAGYDEGHTKTRERVASQARSAVDSATP